MDYEDLINSSTIDDKQTLEDLLALAEKLSVENKHEESTKVFRDSTILYQLAVNANLITESDNSEAYQLNAQCKLIKRWIKAHPFGICPLPRIVEGMTPWFIFCKVDYDLEKESSALLGDSWQLIPLIESTLFRESCIDNAQSSYYHYAGATLPSGLVRLMEDYFGISLKNSEKYWLPEIRISYKQQAEKALERLEGLPLEVRIWVDLLADEIEKRFQASKSEH